MKKHLGKIIIGALLLVIVIGCYAIITRTSKAPSDFEDFKGGIFFSSGTTAGATTTSTNLPVKVLSNNSDRHYATIQNDSDTVVYLHLERFASGAAASTSVLLNQGIRLNADGGTFEINVNNMYTGEIWATSSAANKNILFVEN